MNMNIMITVTLIAQRKGVSRRQKTRRAEDKAGVSNEINENNETNEIKTTTTLKCDLPCTHRHFVALCDTL